MIITKKTEILRDKRAIDYSWLERARLIEPSALDDVGKRIHACAIILASEPDTMRHEAGAMDDSRADRLRGKADRLDALISKIADDKKVDRVTACVALVKGRMRSMIRSGQARSIFDAIEQYERRQDKDKSVSVSGTDGRLAREVARIEAVNGHDCYITRDGHTYHHTDMRDIIAETKKERTKEMKATKSARIVKRLAVEIEDIEARYMAENVAQADFIASAYDDIGTYVKAYVSTLTPTLYASLVALRDSTMTVDQICAHKGHYRHAIKRLRDRMTGGNELSTRDFVEVIRKYSIA